MPQPAAHSTLNHQCGEAGATPDRETPSAAWHYPSPSQAVSRRTFLVASGLGCGATFGGHRQTLNAADRPSIRRQPAKSTILFFLCGGSSHMDMWDLKPQAPQDYRGPFQPIATAAPQVRISEHLPLVAQQSQHLAVINSLGHYGRGTGDHHAGYYYNLTGHEPDPSFRLLGNNRTPMANDWPYMGTVVGAKRPPHPTLPQCISLPHMPSRAPYTRPGQFAAKLGVEHDPLYVKGSREKPTEFHLPALALQAGMDSQRLANRKQLLSTLNDAQREFDQLSSAQRISRQQERAFSLLTAATTTEAFDITREPEALRQRYGNTVNGMSLLMARRLVEASVPFITVFWMEDDKTATKCKSAGGWDTHGNNFNCLKDHLLPEFDRGFSALIEDLSQRGLLDETLVLVTSEMGRKPKIGDPRSGGVTSGLTSAGRDHWTHCMSVVLAGGGIRGGQTYGTSDRLGEYPADDAVSPADIAQTLYHSMGIHDLEFRDPEGRPFNLMADGKPITALF